MNRFWIPLVVFVLLCVVFAAALRRAPEKEFVASALIGKPAQEFTLPDLMSQGGSVNSAAFKGRWVLLNVWATWCVECAKEHSELLDIKRTGKVALLGLNYKDEDDAARQWLAERGNPFDAVAIDHDGRAAIDYGVYGAPETFLVNPAGVIVHKVVGVVTAESWQNTLLPFIEGKTK